MQPNAEKSDDRVLKILPLEQTGRELPSGPPHGGRASRSDIRYWESAIFQRSRQRAGGRITTSKDWRIQLQHQGRREEFNLHTANKSVAARLAREISQHLRVNGWPLTFAQYKPDTVHHQPGAISTVGDFIAALHATQTLNRSLSRYIQSFRQVVAGIFLADEGPDLHLLKYDYRGEGRAEWIARIDQVRLEQITPGLIQRWKIAYLARAGSSPSAQRASRISVNSILRLARSLLAPKRLEFIRESLPSDFRSPFTGVKLEPRQNCRYRSSFDVRALIGSAREELASADSEVYKVFLLALFAGLRRGEIDALEWRAFDWTRLLLHIEATAHLSPKSEDSIGNVDLEPELARAFQAFQRTSNGTFVIAVPDSPRGRAANGKNWYSYRCQDVFERLSRWLRAHGVDSEKPIHTLRKEYGSLVCNAHGIYAASRSLRHADIAITSAYYVDKRGAATPGLGKLL